MHVLYSDVNTVWKGLKDCVVDEVCEKNRKKLAA